MNVSSVLDHLPNRDDEADEFDDEFDEESDGMTPVPDLDDVFRTANDSFQDDLKWKLPSGSTVEDLLYDAYWSKCSRPSIRNLIRNWIVDTGSEKIKALFSESDWAAIKAEVEYRRYLMLSATVLGRFYGSLRYKWTPVW
jgi:hypothetical protein